MDRLYETQLRRLCAPSRVRPKVGDIFVLQVDRTGEFVFGRLIRNDANPLGVGGAAMLYLYANMAASKRPIPELSPKRLLIAPIMTNYVGWVKGYFETIESRSIRPDEVLVVHGFYDSTRDRYLDEYQRSLPGPTEPMGVWGLADLSVITDEVLKALARKEIPVAMEQRWSVWQGELNGQLLIVRANESARRLIGHPGLPMKLGFAVALNRPNQGGLPDVAENAALGNVEDLLVKRVLSSAAGIHAMTLTTGLMREWVFYVAADVDVARLHGALRAEVRTHDLECIADEELEWQTFKEFVPRRGTP